MTLQAPLVTTADGFDRVAGTNPVAPALLSADRRRAWAGVRNLLALRLDNLGDVLMTTPALRAMRQALPAARLSLLASPGAAALQPFLPDLDDLQVYAAPWMKASADCHPAHDLQAIQRIAACRFDAAVIFTSYSQSPLPAAHFCHLAGIPLRLAHCHENPYQLLTDWLPDPEPRRALRHEVRRQLDLVAALGWQPDGERLAFRTDPADIAAMQTRLAGIGIEYHRSWLVLHPGASAASRRYPPALWAQVGDILTRRTGYPLLWTGSHGEVPLVDAIRSAMQFASHSLAGELTLGQFGALLALAPLLVTNNSGPVHLAAATGTPVVDLYALTNPQHAPWGVENRVLFHPVPCGFCYRSVCPESHHACLRKISPESIADAAIELLQPADRAF